jgi:hypothetical protein
VEDPRKGSTPQFRIPLDREAQDLGLLRCSPSLGRPPGRIAPGGGHRQAHECGCCTRARTDSPSRTATRDRLESVNDRHLSAQPERQGLVPVAKIMAFESAAGAGVAATAAEDRNVAR